MNFEWSEQQKELLQAAERFAMEQLAEPVTERDRDHAFNRDAWLKCGDFGVQGLPVPAEFGGFGADALTTVGVLERLGYRCRDNGLLFSINAHLWTVVIPLVTAGTPEQKQKYLPRLANGTLIGANAMSEPGAGSDAFSVSTTARREGDTYVLNGNKTWVTNGNVADVLTVYATTDRAKGAQGVTAFLVDKGTPGMVVGRKIEKMGLRTSPMAEVFFDDCVVPVANRLGVEGGGSVLFSRSMTWERGCILASAVGSMQRVLERSIDYAKTRKQSGQPIGKFQHVAGRIVEMKLRVETARQLLYHSAWLRSRGKAGFLEAAMVKLHVSDSWVKTCEDAIQIHGAYGYTVECELERELRDAIGSRIYSGTTEIQKNLIAGLLGL
jgi:alkylation response protein AidB-like acyl-CoA dehydrogenase